MFDTLVESTARSRSLRGPLFLFGTATVWLLTFAAVIVVGIFVYDAKVSAESESLKLSIVTPPTPAPAPPPQSASAPPREVAVARAFEAVPHPPDLVSDRTPPPPVGPRGDGTVVGLQSSFVDGVGPGLVRNPVVDGGPATIGHPPATPPEPPPVVQEKKPEPPKIVKYSDLRAGRTLRRVEPPYPQLAKSAGVEGTVVVEVTVGESGSVVSTRVVSGHPMLRQAAESAARQWTFTPTILSGTPVKVVGTLTFNFRRS